MGIIDWISYVDTVPKNYSLFGRIGNKRRSGRSIMKNLGLYDHDAPLGINNDGILNVF
jgi:hypothetical protein